MNEIPTLQPYFEAPKGPDGFGDIGALIKPYLNAEGTHFARDFWMVDHLAAMAGALVEDYSRNRLRIVGVGRGIKPLHYFVVGPDDPEKLPNEVMTSPGTPDCGWIAAGERYYYDTTLPESINTESWLRAGAPKWNDYGQWGSSGLPQSYVEWTWLHPSVRGPSPLHPGRRRGRGH